MCFIEYNWTACGYSFRIGDRFQDFRGVATMPTLKDWREYLRPFDIHLVKTDSRTWKLEYVGKIPD